MRNALSRAALAVCLSVHLTGALHADEILVEYDIANATGATQSSVPIVSISPLVGSASTLDDISGFAGCGTTPGIFMNFLGTTYEFSITPAPGTAIEFESIDCAIGGGGFGEIGTYSWTWRTPGGFAQPLDEGTVVMDATWHPIATSCASIGVQTGTIIFQLTVDNPFPSGCVGLGAAPTLGPDGQNVFVRGSLPDEPPAPECDPVAVNTTNFLMPGDRLGEVLEVAGDLLVATASGGDQVRLYERELNGNWNSTVFFPYSDAVDVAVSSNGWVAVGRPTSGFAGAGRVELGFFTGSTVTSIAVVGTPTVFPFPVLEFGTSVALSDDAQWLVVGAPGTLGDTGYVFLYRRTGSTWSLVDSVSEGQQGARFGEALDISGTKVIVGAPMRDTSQGVDAGEVFFYDIDAGTAKLVLSSSSALFSRPGAQLGASVAIDGDQAVAGVPHFAFHPSVDNGAAFFYSDESYFDIYYGNTNARAGSSVAVDVTAGVGARYLVGEPGEESVALLQSTASFSLELLDRFGAFESAVGEGSGTAVALQGDECFVGAPFSSAVLPGAGRVVGFDSLFSTNTLVDLGSSLAGVTGAPQLEVVGTLCPGELASFELTNAAPNAFSALFVGTIENFVPFKGGILVPKTEVELFVPTNASGAFSLPVEYPEDIPAVTITIQWWIKDDFGPQGFAGSNAIRILPVGE